MELTQRSIRLQTNEVPSPENLQKAITKSNKQIDRLLSLVNDLLDPEKMDSGQFSRGTEFIIHLPLDPPEPEPSSSDLRKDLKLVSYREPALS